MTDDERNKFSESYLKYWNRLQETSRYSAFSPQIKTNKTCKTNHLKLRGKDKTHVEVIDPCVQRETILCAYFSLNSETKKLETWKCHCQGKKDAFIITISITLSFLMNYSSCCVVV